MMELFGIFLSYGYVFFLLISGGILSKKNKELSRKYVHILSANWWFIAMVFFDVNSIWPIVIPGTFIIVNYISYKYRLFKAIESVEERGLGTVYYAVSLFVLAILSFAILKMPIIGAFGILIMGYGDGLAALIGQKIKSRFWYKNKSIAGTTTMLLVSFIISFVLFYIIGYPYYIVAAIVVAITATITEAYGQVGTDNILVPLVTSIMVILFIYFV